KITSDFLFNPQSWTFQSDVPHLWSQYTISLPQFLDYMVIAQGELPYYLNDRKDREGNYMVAITKEVYGGTMSTERVDITCAVADFRWAMKDIPALKEEAYTSTTDNYVAKLEFQLAGFLPPFTERKVMTTWADMTKDLMRSSIFGGQLANTELWLPSILKPVMEGSTSQTHMAQKIYDHVRNNFTCIGHSQLFADEPLPKIADKKRGGVAEINLLLTAMFRAAGLEADPVILSTRDNGFVSDEYPVFRPFNYVICRVKADGKEWLVDASRANLGFGKLHYKLYNGNARVVNEAATVIPLTSDQLQEKRQTTIFIYKETAGKWTGNVKKTYGFYASGDLREKLASEGKQGLLKDLNAEYNDNELKIDSVVVDSLTKLDAPLTVNYVVKNENEGADIIYFNPVLGIKYTKNPFISADRQYPVELPYRINELYTLNMEIPDGYVVDEMPKPIKLSFNTNTIFDYAISQAAGRLTLNYKLDLGTTVFFPSEYDALREFFGKVVARLNEQVVFKKKK
ncbi:MAG TPA: DUF3858 domain-containing protein, partial [Chitinophagaceae bacterium]|nr:DUF3858 domain-containing protein [Chitinophagaceae bacterium]